MDTAARREQLREALVAAALRSIAAQGLGGGMFWELSNDDGTLLAALRAGLGGTVTVRSVPIPLDCTDGFNEAYYGRPEKLLISGARQSCSAWSFIDDELSHRYAEHLAADLRSGAWDVRHGALRRQASYEGSLVIVRATAARSG